MAWARAARCTRMSTSTSVIPGLRNEYEPSISAWAPFPARQIAKSPRLTVRERCARIGRLPKIGSEGEVSERRWVCGLETCGQETGAIICETQEVRPTERVGTIQMRRIARAAGEACAAGTGRRSVCIRVQVGSAHHRRRDALTGPGPSSPSGHRLHNPDQLEFGDTRLKRFTVGVRTWIPKGEVIHSCFGRMLAENVLPGASQVAILAAVGLVCRTGNHGKHWALSTTAYWNSGHFNRELVIRRSSLVEI